MQRDTATYRLAPSQAAEIKQKMLNWANRFSILLFLDSNNYPSHYKGYECLLGAGAVQLLQPEGGDMLTALHTCHNANKDWLFGHICYDYKDILEPKLVSAHDAHFGLPLLQFFVPETVCYINREQTTLTISTYAGAKQVYNEIVAIVPPGTTAMPQLTFSHHIDRDRYIKTINTLRRHIADGDCYEINFCTEGFVPDAVIEPLQVYESLNALSPAPFAAYYRTAGRHMMCASPERYLRKEGSRIISQPIKGTARRDADPVKDTQIKKMLQTDIKERAENVMIVDLTRNDIARSCATGSVQVDELFGVYSFPQVHQLISTVSGQLRNDVPFTDAIRYSFPMGSMTGAPKFKVMQLIEQYERSRRELFSGTVGYITPSGDFDFNVIIRSLFYNATTRYLSYQTGGAITYDSDPEKEWEEMRLKAWALERIFQ